MYLAKALETAHLMDTVASNSGTPDMHGSGRTQRQKRQDANSSCRDGREIQNTAATFHSK